MDRITDAFIWPTRDPEWPTKLLVIALTMLIPIVGSINGIGWMLASLDRLRAGDERLAPASLRYVGRGIRLFLVEVIYPIAVIFIALVILLPALALEVQQGQGTANSVLIAAAVFLNILGFSVVTVLSLALTFAMPAIVLATDAGGIAGGIQVGGVARRSRMNLTHTLIAGLMLIAASFIGSLGMLVCGIGILVTSVYALAMQAWIVRSFEKG